MGASKVNWHDNRESTNSSFHPHCLWSYHPWYGMKWNFRSILNFWSSSPLHLSLFLGSYLLPLFFCHQEDINVVFCSSDPENTCRHNCSRDSLVSVFLHLCRRELLDRRKIASVCAGGLVWMLSDCCILRVAIFFPCNRARLVAMNREVGWNICTPSLTSSSRPTIKQLTMNDSLRPVLLGRFLNCSW